MGYNTRLFRFSLMPGICLVGLLGCRPRNGEGHIAGITTTKKLSEKYSYHLRIQEASGLCQFKDRATGRHFILAVSDSSSNLLKISIDDFASKSPKYENLSISDVRNGTDFLSEQGKGSQWEAIQSDATGKVFIAEEAKNRILVVNLYDFELIAKINLKMEETADIGPKIVEGWRNQTDRNAEGFLLLKNGHILVAKERDPPILIEFGPSRDEAEGLTVTNPIVTHRDVFAPLAHIAYAKGVKELDYYALKVWMPNNQNPVNIDLSELAYQSNGRVAVLSDELNAIYTLEGQLKPAEKAYSFRAMAPLPKKISKAEGLVYLDLNQFLVASDTVKDEDNFFIFSHED